MREEIAALRSSNSPNRKESNCESSPIALSNTNFSNIIIKEALSNIPRFDGRNLLPFIRSSKRAIDLVPRSLQGEVIKLLKNKLDDNCYALMGPAQYDCFDDFQITSNAYFHPMRH